MAWALGVAGTLTHRPQDFQPQTSPQRQLLTFKTFLQTQTLNGDF